jgi:hypothetical protein
MGNMVLVNSGFHMQHILSERYAQSGHAPSVKFANPVLNWESLKNISLKERQIINLPGAPSLRYVIWPVDKFQLDSASLRL